MDASAAVWGHRVDQNGAGAPAEDVRAKILQRVGTDVVAALHENPGTATIPILIVTSKSITAQDRDELNGFVSTIMEKADFDGDRFALEVRRALTNREAVV